MRYIYDDLFKLLRNLNSITLYIIIRAILYPGGIHKSAVRYRSLRSLNVQLYGAVTLTSYSII